MSNKIGVAFKKNGCYKWNREGKRLKVEYDETLELKHFTKLYEKLLPLSVNHHD